MSDGDIFAETAQRARALLAGPWEQSHSAVIGRALGVHAATLYDEAASASAARLPFATRALARSIGEAAITARYMVQGPEDAAERLHEEAQRQGDRFRQRMNLEGPGSPDRHPKTMPNLLQRAELVDGGAQARPRVPDARWIYSVVCGVTSNWSLHASYLVADRYLDHQDEAVRDQGRASDDGSDYLVMCGIALAWMLVGLLEAVGRLPDDMHPLSPLLGLNATLSMPWPLS